MTSVERIAATVMLVAGGSWLGVLLAVGVDRTHAWGLMPLSEYAIDFRRCVRRLDPLQPLLLIATLAAAVLFAVNASSTGAVLSMVACVLLGAVLIGSVVLTEPMNSKFRRLPEGEIPVDAAALRATWRRLHTARTVVAVAAFVCLALAATYP